MNTTAQLNRINRIARNGSKIQTKKLLITLAFKLFSNNPTYGKRMTTPSNASIPNGARSNNPYPFKKFVFEKIL